MRGIMSGLPVWAMCASLAALAGSSGCSKKESAGLKIVRDVPHLEGEEIVFSSAFRQRAGIELTPVRRVSLRPAHRVVGTVTFDPAHVAAVGTRVRGFVRATFKFEGDSVKAGEALGEIESAEVGQAQADVTAATARVEAAELDARRERELLERKLTTQREAEIASVNYATAKSALAAARQRVAAFGGGSGNFGVFVLRSPVAGHVVDARLSPGQSVEDNLLAYRVADLRYLWVELGLPERNAFDVRLRDDVELSPVGAPGRKIIGRVAHVGSVVDVSTRSTDVRVAVDNAAACASGGVDAGMVDGDAGARACNGKDDEAYMLRPGQSVFATLFASGSAKNALVIPQSAVVYVDGKAKVFVGSGDNRVVPTDVTLGASDTSNVEVIEGLREGQLVASSGVFPLKSELFR
jgi:membrane fusion protein, heavy metal efflux system